MDDNWKHFEEKDRMIEDDLRKNVDDMRHQFDEKDRYLYFVSWQAACKLPKAGICTQLTKYMIFCKTCTFFNVYVCM